jgi:Sulfotransferase family
VVGPSRSGTSLLRQILNRHDRVWLTGETFYFDDLRPRLGRKATEPLDRDALALCEEFFAPIKGRHSRFAVELSEVRTEAERIGSGGDAYFEAFCRLRARLRGRELWGEKTPRHVFRIAEMVAAYPGARVICLLRDPRAVVASHRDFWRRSNFAARGAGKAGVEPGRKYARSRQQYNLVLTSLLWNATMDAASEARNRFGAERVTTLRFEDLVTRPEPSIRGLAGWLGIDYQDAMLDEVRVVKSSYASIDGQEGISSEPLTRWRGKLTDADIQVIEMLTGRVMRELDYEPARVKASRLSVARVFLDLPIDTAQAFWVNRHRLSRTFDFVGRRLAPLVRRTGART